MGQPCFVESRANEVGDLPRRVNERCGRHLLGADLEQEVLHVRHLGHPLFPLCAIRLGCDLRKVRLAAQLRHGTDAQDVVRALRDGDGSARIEQVKRMLMSSNSRVVSKQDLLTRVWGASSEASENSVEAYVSFLRKKLAHIDSRVQVTTLRMSTAPVVWRRMARKTSGGSSG